MEIPESDSTPAFTASGSFPGVTAAEGGSSAASDRTRTAALRWSRETSVRRRPGVWVSPPGPSPAPARDPVPGCRRMADRTVSATNPAGTAASALSVGDVNAIPPTLRRSGSVLGVSAKPPAGDSAGGRRASRMRGSGPLSPLTGSDRTHAGSGETCPAGSACAGADHSWSCGPWSADACPSGSISALQTPGEHPKAGTSETGLTHLGNGSTAPDLPTSTWLSGAAMGARSAAPGQLGNPGGRRSLTRGILAGQRSWLEQCPFDPSGGRFRLGRVRAR